MDAATRKAKLEEIKTSQLNQAMTGIPLRYKGTTRTEIVWRLQKHRFAWRYARDYLNPTVEAERIVIPVGDNEPYAVMSNISSMLAKYGFIEDQSKSTEQVVIDYYEEERRFKEFSEKALNIRNNECDTEEFAEFTKSVAENLPSRSLYPLQLLSAYHMAFSQNACNFSVPGAGKTSIVYGA